MTLATVWFRAAGVRVQRGLGVFLCFSLAQAVASASDGGPVDTDAGTGGATAACSCETKTGEGGRRIHLCTGSFHPDVCVELGTRCNPDEARNASCYDDVPVRLCCEMKARRVYTYLYEDCTHPNCERAFRAQCEDFEGEVLDGMCGDAAPPSMPAFTPDRPKSCHIAIGHWSGGSTGERALWLLGLGFVLRRARRRYSLI